MTEMLASVKTCPQFGRCGGCTTDSSTQLPFTYEQQLAQKEASVRGLLTPFLDDASRFFPIIPAPEQWHYRNKMEFSFGWPEGMQWEESLGKLVLGMKEKGRFDRVVSAGECLLMSPQAGEIVQRMTAWVNQHQIPCYHSKRHSGGVRHLVVREGKNTGERSPSATVIHQEPSAGGGRMMNLVVSPEIGNAWTDVWTEELKTLFQELATTFILSINGRKSDVALGEMERILWGDGKIREQLGGLTLELTSTSFFQTNTRAAEKLYGIIRDWTPKQGAVLDAYCGCGGIGLFIAPQVERVFGVEMNAASIESAKAAAKANGIVNAEFICEDTGRFARHLIGSRFHINLTCVIVDPPRPGLHPNAIPPLLELNAPEMIYVSCNPESLAVDLQKLFPFYRVVQVQPVDQFPQTDHVETVVHLKHR